MSFYHSLVANGLYRDLESACILVPIMHVMAFRPLSKLLKLMKQTRDLVNTEDIRHIAEKIKI